MDSFNKDQNARLKALDGLKKAIEIKAGFRDSLTEQILEKEKNITSVQPAVDEINRSLKAYDDTDITLKTRDGKERSFNVANVYGCEYHMDTRFR